MPDQVKNNFFQINWPGISWALLILVLSSITPPKITTPELFEPDKVVHVVFYFVFVFLFCKSFSRMPGDTFWARNRFSIPLISGMIYGGLIELYQGYLLPDRMADWADFAANCAGALLGWAWVKRKKI